MKKQIIFTLVLNLVSMKLKHLTTAIILLFAIVAQAQDTIYFDKYQSEIQNATKAEFYRVIRRDSLDKNSATATEYFKSGEIKSTASLVAESSIPAKDRKAGMQAFFYSKDGKTKWLYNGKYMEWYKNGKLKKKIDFRNGGVNKQLLTFWPQGQIKRKEVYDDDWKMLSGNCLNSDGTRVAFTPYIQSPAFNAGDISSIQTFVNNNFKYPTTISDAKIMGKVLINCYINTKGNVYKNTLIRGIEPEVDQKVISLLDKLPPCVMPAMCDGEPTAFVLISSVVICKPSYTVDLFLNSTGKDSVYYNKDGFVQKERKGAKTIELLSTNSSDTNELTQTIYFPSGKVKSSTTIDKKMSIENINKKYKSLNVNSSNSIQLEFMQHRIRNGKSTSWYENGQLKSEFNYLSNKLEGEQLYYAQDGTVANGATFENGMLISGNEVDVIPQFPGGERAMFEDLNKNIHYPLFAQMNNIKGEVVIGFVVETDGTITNIEIIKSVDTLLDSEAVRVVEIMPKWAPGIKGGVAVPVWVSLPVNFRLNQGGPSQIQIREFDNNPNPNKIYYDKNVQDRRFPTQYPYR